MTKQDLRQFRAMNAEIEQIRERIREIELTLADPKVQDLSGVPNGGYVGQDRLYNTVSKLADLKSLYADKLNKLVETTLSIERSLNVLEVKERLLIRSYYFEGLTWEEVAAKMGFVRMQVHRIHGRALLKLANQ